MRTFWNGAFNTARNPATPAVGRAQRSRRNVQYRRSPDTGRRNHHGTHAWDHLLLPHVRQQLSRYRLFPHGEPYLKFTTKGTSTPPSVTLGPASASPSAPPTSPDSSTPTRRPARSAQEPKPYTKPNGMWNALPHAPVSLARSKPKKATKRFRARSNASKATPSTKTSSSSPTTDLERRKRLPKASPLLSSSPRLKGSPGGSAGAGSYNVGGIVTPFNTKISNCHLNTGRRPNTSTAPPVRRIPSAATRSRASLSGPILNSNQLRSSSPSEARPRKLWLLGPLRRWWNPTQGALRSRPGRRHRVEFESGFFYVMYTIHFSGPLSSQNVGPLRILRGGETVNSPGGNFAGQRLKAETMRRSSSKPT